MNDQPAPDLWPRMDRTTCTAQAWIEIWNTLSLGGWFHMADVIDSVNRSHPELARKTIDNLIRKARTARLVQRRGGYSRKTKTDTREIRRHPATQEPAP